MGSIQQHLAKACDLTVISCSDFRLQRHDGLSRAIHAVYGLDIDFDLLALPGSCHPLVRESDADREQVLKRLSVSVDLHQPETVLIVQHTECGAYLSYMAFENEAHERRVLTEDIRNSARIIRARFPNVKVEGCIATLRDGCVVGLGRVQIPDEVSPVAEKLESLRA